MWQCAKYINLSANNCCIKPTTNEQSKRTTRRKNTSCNLRNVCNETLRHTFRKQECFPVLFDCVIQSPWKDGRLIRLTRPQSPLFTYFVLWRTKRHTTKTLPDSEWTCIRCGEKNRSLEAYTRNKNPLETQEFHPRLVTWHPLLPYPPPPCFQHVSRAPHIHRTRSIITTNISFFTHDALLRLTDNPIAISGHPRTAQH
jgi:hypothetical protein